MCLGFKQWISRYWSWLNDKSLGTDPDPHQHSVSSKFYDFHRGETDSIEGKIAEICPLLLGYSDLDSDDFDEENIFLLIDDSDFNLDEN